LYALTYRLINFIIQTSTYRNQSREWRSRAKIKKRNQRVKKIWLICWLSHKFLTHSMTLPKIFDSQYDSYKDFRLCQWLSNKYITLKMTLFFRVSYIFWLFCLWFWLWLWESESELRCEKISLSMYVYR